MAAKWNKTHLNKEKQIISEEQHRNMAMESFVTAWKTILTLSSAQNAFAKSGILPYNPQIAFANAGVNLSKITPELLFSGVSIGIFLGLFVGKQIGVFLFAYLAIKAKLASLPQGATFRQLYGVCILTGIGFTMSLFIDGLAYEVSDIFSYADNLSILIASLCSGIFGFIFLRFFAKTKPIPNPQS